MADIKNSVLVFILPLFIAGFLHHFLIIRYNLFRYLAKPIDFGITSGGRRILGDSKTFRGFAVMMLGTGFFLWLINSFLNIPLRTNSFTCGIILGFGYSLGELPNSFFKRKCGIRNTWAASGFLKLLFCVLDQTDSIIGAIIFLPLVYTPRASIITALFFAGTFLHIVFDSLLYKFGYKKELKNKFKA